MKTFQQFQENAAIARGALKLLKSATKGAKATRTADGGRRVTSATRRARNVPSRAVSRRGPAKDRWARVEDRRNTSDKAALKKAGFKRNNSDESYRDTESWSSPHHSTSVGTYKNQSDYAIYNIPDKNLRTGGIDSSRVKSTASRVRHARALRKQMGGDRTPKQVHDVAIFADTPHHKNDPDNLIQRGRSFRKEVGAVPSALKRAGAKPGDKVTAEPSAIMGGEDRVKGKQKRDKIYAKVFGYKMNPKTGKTMGNYRDIDNN